MNQALEHFADHSEMIAVTFELPLQIDKICCGGIESLG
jgi:hypothetical protein